MLAAWPKSMTKISDRIQMTAKLPHEVKLLVASSSLCFRGILHDKEATIFFFRKCFQGKTYAAKCHILLLELYLFIMLSELEVNQGAKIAIFFFYFYFWEYESFVIQIPFVSAISAQRSRLIFNAPLRSPYTEKAMCSGVFYANTGHFS